MTTPISIAYNKRPLDRLLVSLIEHIWILKIHLLLKGLTDGTPCDRLQESTASVQLGGTLLEEVVPASWPGGWQDGVPEVSLFQNGMGQLH